jgi:hypothetical protein
MTNTYAPELTQQQILDSIYYWTAQGTWAPGIAFPTGPTLPNDSSVHDRDFFFRTTNSHLYQYQGGDYPYGSWVDLQEAAKAILSFGTSLPGSASEGDLFNKYNDGLIYQWINGAWRNIGSNKGGLPLGVDAINFTDNYKTWRSVNLGMLLTSDTGHSPLLATDQGFVVKKDLAAGGFLSTQQGEVWIGHGRHDSTDVPKIILMHSGYETLYLRKLVGTSVAQSANLNIGKLEVQSTNNVFAVTAGDNGVNQDTYLVPQNPSQGGLGLGTVAYPFKWVDATYVYTNNISSLSGGAISVHVALDSNSVIHGGGSSGDAFKVGDDIYIVDVNNANRLSLQGAQSRTQAGIQFGSGGMWLYRDSAYLRCSSGLIVDGYIVAASWANTTQYGPLYRNASGQIGYNTSALRFKDNISDEEDCSWLYKLRPVTFDWKDQQRKQEEGRQLGLIAEEVNELYPQLVFHDSEGKPEGVHYEWLGVPLIVEMKKLRNRVEALENQLKQNQVAA